MYGVAGDGVYMDTAWRSSRPRSGACSRWYGRRGSRIEAGTTSPATYNTEAEALVVALESTP